MIDEVETTLMLDASFEKDFAKLKDLINFLYILAVENEKEDFASPIKKLKVDKDDLVGEKKTSTQHSFRSRTFR
ncbi:hypothetical protein P8452_07081 [Trifolium repens]|nr:hypothetical protein P8452_07081 [Trifolium repens]